MTAIICQPGDNMIGVGVSAPMCYLFLTTTIWGRSYSFYLHFIDKGWYQLDFCLWDPSWQWDSSYSESWGWLAVQTNEMTVDWAWAWPEDIGNSGEQVFHTPSTLTSLPGLRPMALGAFSMTGWMDQEKKWTSFTVESTHTWPQTEVYCYGGQLCSEVSLKRSQEGKFSMWV